MLLKEINIKQFKSAEPAQKKFGQLIKSPPHGEDPSRSLYDLEGKKDSDVERLGTGFYATTYAEKGEPGTAIKVARPIFNLEHDAYFQYVSMLAKHKEGTDNRYFPKIYDVKVFADEHGKYTYSVDMERLSPFRDLSVDELLRIGNHIFNNFDQMVADANEKKRNMKYQDRMAKRQFGSSRQHSKEDKIKDTESYIWAVQRAITSGIGKCLGPNADPATNIKDSELKRALIMLRAMINKSQSETEFSKRRGPDVHQGNIMVRRGPFMPQLVITDPVV